MPQPSETAVLNLAFLSISDQSHPPELFKNEPVFMLAFFRLRNLSR